MHGYIWEARTAAMCSMVTILLLALFGQRVAKCLYITKVVEWQLYSGTFIIVIIIDLQWKNKLSIILY